jgi:hypothetical protein
MAFGRKKRREQADQEEGQGLATTGGVEQTAAADELPTAPDEPDALLTENGAVPPPEVAPAGDDELAQAAFPAGDPAAAGVDAEGPGADLRSDHATYEVAAATEAPAAGEWGSAGEWEAAGAGPGDARELGSAAASPDPAAVPGAQEPAADEDRATGVDVTESAAAAADRAQSLVDARPELLVAGAFAVGVVAARVLSALGGDE